jgi:tRNA(His) guanylyltransferase
MDYSQYGLFSSGLFITFYSVLCGIIFIKFFDWWLNLLRNYFSVPMKLIPKALGDRMKYYENQYETRVNNKDPYVIRLDGHSFSKFTNSLQQPWDLRFLTAMSLTTADLLLKFQATTGYTQSDEITLTFFSLPNVDSGEYTVLSFSGRIQKLTSLCAGYASARFNFHLNALVSEPTYRSKYQLFPTRKYNDEELSVAALDKISNFQAHFDARCIQFPNSGEVANCVLWRTRDAYRNVISKTAQNMFGVRKCFKQCTRDKVKMIEEEDPKCLSSLHPFIAHGVFIKRKLYDCQVDGNFYTRSTVDFIPASSDRPSVEFLEQKHV